MTRSKIVRALQQQHNAHASKDRKKLERAEARERKLCDEMREALTQVRATRGVARRPGYLVDAFGKCQRLGLIQSTTHANGLVRWWLSDQGYRYLAVRGW